MKKIYLLALGLLSASITFAQKTAGGQVINAEEIQVEFHGVTGTLIDYVEPPGTVNEITKTKKTGYHPKDDWILNEKVNPNALPQGEDPALQKNYPPAAVNKALNYNWDAIGNFNVSPADPTVDVGPNHVVHMTNGPSGAYIQVYSKTGTPIGSQVYFDNFMSMPGGLGDPIVLYDERADRWMLSEFSQSGNNMHVAISTTPDPTGTYYTYSFNAPSFPDYPKYSIWEDAYIITTNESGNSPIYAINRADLLSGTATTAQRFTVPSFGTIGFQAATPVSLNGTAVPPANTPPMVMRMRDDAWAGVPDDALEIWDVNIDWANASNSSVTQNIVLGMGAVPAFDSELCGYTSFSCIDQPGTTTNLDPLREVLMNRIHYRNFGTHESIVCCHVTDVDGNDQAGIRWYELRRTGGASGSWTIYQEGTYAPDTDSRWMPSIGLSASGNIVLAYNVSSATTYPSMRYTGRQECDPLNVMTEPETEIATGTTYNGSNRYGDYNAMGYDPSDGETFYFTAVYNPTTGGRTRIAAFNIPVCAQYPEVVFNVSTLDVDESSADVANGCMDYIVVDVPMSIGIAPSQNADITVTVTGGTATQGVDFDLVGSSFTLNGGSLTGSAQLHIYNDNYVEGNETINLGYTLNANGGDAYAGATNQTVLVTIIDDDLDPASMINTVTVFSHDFESGMAPFTTVNNAGGPTNDPFAVGDAAAASSTAFTVPATNATQMAWINDDACDCDQNDVDLISPSFDLTGYTGAALSFSSYYENNSYAGNQEVASVMVSVGGGPFNLVQLVPSGSWNTVNVDLTPYVGNSNVQVAFNYSDGTGWLYGWAIDDVVVTGDGPISVQTAVNSGAGMTANLGPNETVHFYDPATDRVMMTLENTSSWDYGCVTVEVDRDGSSPTALEFNSTNIADYLHSKTYTVSPANNNPSGTYNMTVYYEEAEVAAWESFTGNSRNNAEIIKVAGNNRINDVTPATAGSYNIVSNTATLGAFNADVTFTASFATGFSGFGVGIYNPGAMAPTSNFSASSTTTCTGVAVSFTDLSGGTPTSWDWDFGDGGTSTQQNPSYTYNTAGTYSVTLTVTNAYGTDVQTQTAYINVTNGISYTQNIDLCPGGSVTVGSSTYSSAGSYTDLLTAPNGCDSTVTTNITMLAPITYTQNVEICPGGSVTVGTSTYTTAGSYTDNLSTPQGCDSTVTTNVSMLSTSSSTQNLEICEGGSVTVGSSTYSTSGTYTDVFTNAAGCDSTVTTNLTVNPLPTTSITPNVIDTMCLNTSSPITLVGSPNGGSFSGNGVSGTTFDPSAAGAGSHTITYSYTDGNGCTNTSTVLAIVIDCSGIEENQLSGVILSPNPNDGNFMIKGLDMDSEYAVIDSRGRIVLEGKVTSANEEVHVENIQSGVYYLHGKSGGKLGSLKFIVTK